QAAMEVLFQSLKIMQEQVEETMGWLWQPVLVSNPALATVLGAWFQAAAESREDVKKYVDRSFRQAAVLWD
ncbi:MAG: hypothetical protein AB1896_16715, partial [Thermodesulfobacteriota bacterium]